MSENNKSCDEWYSILSTGMIGLNPFENISSVNCSDLSIKLDNDSGLSINDIRQDQDKSLKQHIDSYPNRIKEFGRERVDAEISKKKAIICATKRFVKSKCDPSKKSESILDSKYLPWIVGGISLYFLTKK